MAPSVLVVAGGSCAAAMSPEISLKAGCARCGTPRLSMYCTHSCGAEAIACTAPSTPIWAVGSCVVATAPEISGNPSCLNVGVASTPLAGPDQTTCTGCGFVETPAAASAAVAATAASAADAAAAASAVCAALRSATICPRIEGADASCPTMVLGSSKTVSNT